MTLFFQLICYGKYIQIIIKRLDNTNGNVMIKYAINSTSGGRLEKWIKMYDGQEQVDLNIQFPRVPLGELL